MAGWRWSRRLRPVCACIRTTRWPRTTRIATTASLGCRPVSIRAGPGALNDVWSDLVVSEDTNIHKRTPGKNLKLGKPRRVEVKLASFAQGFGDEKASLSEKTKFYPQRLRHSTFTFQRSKVFRQRWTGQRGGVVNLTSGVELSWAVDDPPDAISSGLLYDFERRGRC